jgi:phosphoribosyl 1,2-cyclic phosphodiesterase
MRVFLCGVRGSTPAPGKDFVRVGGNTSCVAIAHDGDAAPNLVLDGGTGLRQVTSLLGGEPFRGTILLGHLHWDHTQGLPFFTAGGLEGAKVRLVMPEQGYEPESLLTRMMGPPFFPIEPHQLGADWVFETIAEGTTNIEGFTVLAREVPHTGGVTFGYRVSDGHSTVCYMSDHGPIALGPGPDGWGPYHEAALALVEGADLVLHDAQFTPDELARFPHYGHSAVPYAVELARRGGAKHLCLYHHEPSRTDDAVDALVRDLHDCGLLVTAAAEGDIIDL